ncbi:aldehyde dehydrogenase [Methylobacterium sp. Leaf456]|uniref:aldehyde dehydrogenase n=1 Tax=Methylobacterium sp. Leaf456 TaxID=1736382 RepID=UPI0006F9A961|nr:aldehyde dehydrogenase [Methylobacterium sp. Leaf456]KQT58532.1 aldehyde dehydrogenase [Methylobacterium sp. Leaf456]
MNAPLANYIGGKLIDSPSLDRLPVLNPSTGRVISEMPVSKSDAVDEAVAAARKAQVSWGRRPAIQRANLLRAISARIRERGEPIARLISEEQGKLLGLAKVEVAFAADYLDYMAEWARRIEGEIIESDRPGENIFLFRKPVGVVGAILPWNFPFFLIVRKLGPALVTGNSIVIKPSEETPLNAAAFVQLLDGLDIPEGLINFVYGTGACVGEAICAHPHVDLISFTGSAATGSRIMATAARNITKVNLELGGKAPAIVLKDADLDKAAKAVAASRCLNSGQVCNAAERVYVERPVAEDFAARVTAEMKRMRVGDPLGASEIDMGPMINRSGVEKVDELVRSALDSGATVTTGGKGRSDEGTYYEPTVLTGCRQDMDVMRKEIFGPVLPIMSVDSLEEAIDLANDTEYGLTSSIYTESLSAALKASRELGFGETYINRENFEAMQGFHAGNRKSGIGGADGKHGLYEYTSTHVVYMQT